MSTDDKTILKIKDIAKSAIPSGSKAISVSYTHLTLPTKA